MYSASGGIKVTDIIRVKIKNYSLFFIRASCISSGKATYQVDGLVKKYHQSEWLQLTSQEMTDVGGDVEKGEPSYTVGGNASWCSHSGKQYGSSSKS